MRKQHANIMRAAEMYFTNASVEQRKCRPKKKRDPVSVFVLSY